MADELVADFSFAKLDPDSGNPAQLQTSELKRAAGVSRVFFGAQLENPDVGVIVSVRRASDEPPVPDDSGHPRRPYRAVLSPAAAAEAVLAAPTIEVCIGYGAEAGFEANVREFAAKLDAEAPAGYRGVAAGAVEFGTAASDDTEAGPAVLLVIGWDSKEAHLAAKEKPGAIQENIGLIRVLRKKIEMWHVNLEEYV